MSTAFVFEPFTGVSDQLVFVDGMFPRMRGFATTISGPMAFGEFPQMDSGVWPDVVGEVLGQFPGFDGFASEYDTVVRGDMPKMRGYASEDTFITPDLCFVDGQFPYMRSDNIVLVQNALGYVDGEFPRLDGFATDITGPIARLAMPQMQSLVFDLIQFVGGPSMYQEPGDIYIGGPLDGRSVVLEQLSLTSTTKGQPIFHIMEQLGLLSPVTTRASMKSVIHEELQLGDTLAIIWKLLVTEHLNLNPSITPTTIHAAHIVDLITLVAGPPTSHLSARNAVASALALLSHAGIVFKNTIIEHLDLTDAVKSKLAAYAKILDDIILNAHTTQGATFAAVVHESLVLHDSVHSAATMFNLVREGLYLGAQIKIGDDLYTAWVVNTSNRAATEYNNYAFNSFFEVGGKYFGVADDGVNELTGVTDNSEEIESYLRTGLTDFGTGKMKRLPSMYIGYTSNGTVVLKAITTSPEGEKIENWYTMTSRTANVTREARISLGRGMESVYWQFELHNVKGSTFDINTMEMLPVILDRRIRSN